MTLVETWLRRPQSVWLRKALFQVHLWTGIGLGLYVLLISVSGSAIVFRNELYTSLWPGPKVVAASGERLTKAQLKEAVQRAYPGYTISWIWEAKRPNEATDVWMEKNGNKKQRLFDPFNGKDLGESRPYSIQVLAWIGDFHTNLLAGKKGRVANGVAAALVTLLSLSGAVIWWPGIANWRRSLTLHRGVNWKRLNWDLHSALGFWTFAFVFMWAITGVYVVFPAPFQKAVDRFAPLDQLRLEPAPRAMLENGAKLVQVAQRPRRRRGSLGDEIVRWFTYLHFGNFGNWPVKAIWTVLGLAPPALLVTGVLMWWNRVVRGRIWR
jgi:uncharacterized iron-regulated membrane protein